MNNNNKFFVTLKFCNVMRDWLIFNAKILKKLRWRARYTTLQIIKPCITTQTSISAQSSIVLIKKTIKMVLKKMFAIESDPNHTQDLVWTYQIFQVVILS